MTIYRGSLLDTPDSPSAGGRLRAGAEALDLADDVGDLSVGRRFDAVWMGPGDGSTLDVALHHARDVDDALATVFAPSGPAEVRGCGWAAIVSAESMAV